jgi:hypothetical protein
MMCQNPHMEGHVFRANDRTAIVSENPWIPITYNGTLPYQEASKTLYLIAAKGRPPLLLLI